MDGYPSAFLAHNIPLVIVSGLLSAHKEDSALEDGVRISSDIPQVESEAATILLRFFQENDASQLAWNSREFSGKNRLRVKTIARDYTLPLRTATLNFPNHNLIQASKIILHSTHSPLSPGSALFPDGLICPKWIEKHHELVPSAYISFYNLTSDPKFSERHDDRLKLDINNIKKILSLSGYKTRLIIVLLGDESMTEFLIEKRLASIRGETGLDARTCLIFLPSKNSSDEVKEFYKNLVSSVYPICIEYYRDLSKHSRRKKNRGTIPRPTAPPTSGTSQILSSQGWNFRYDFKLGLFAEFRQEMDSAQRSYENAYEALLGPDILEAIASWSPRWNEARCLADVLALRIIRCLLWGKRYSSAVHRWISHKERIKDFVDRRGKGTATYGWEAWESRWATAMGEIIQKVSIPEFNENTIYMPLEKDVTLHKLQPWEYLHHPGYWFRVASNHLISRRNLALLIPEEDRLDPGSTLGSQSANKSNVYDTYMCPPPHQENPLHGLHGTDHCSLIIESLKKAIFEFERRKQSRIVQELKIISVQELMKQNSWQEALKILVLLRKEMSYRQECWWNAVEEVLWTLRKVAVFARDAASIIAVDWELMNKDFTHQSNWSYDLAISLRGLNLETKPFVEFRSNELHSFLTASYTFDVQKAKVGETCTSQLAIFSSAILSAAPVTISEISIYFEGTIKTITLRHKDSLETSPQESRPVSIIQIQLFETIHEDSVGLTGESYLMLKPGQTTVFEFKHFLTEPGKNKAVSAKFSFSMDLFDLNYIHDLQSKSTIGVWWEEKSKRKKLVRGINSSITILPKPPKMELQLAAQNDEYYIDEQINLCLIVANEEESDSLVNLVIQLNGDHTPQITVEIEPNSNDNIDAKREDNQEIELGGTHIGQIDKGKSVAVKFVIPPLKVPGRYKLIMKAVYYLFSNLKTPVEQTTSTELELINPFEVKCDYSPRVHNDPWPSLFIHEEYLEKDQQSYDAQGIAQKWSLTAHLMSTAVSDILVTDVQIEILNLDERIQCLPRCLSKIPGSGIHLTTKKIEELQFDISAQKLNLDDHGTASLDMLLVISWNRNCHESAINRTKIPIPRLAAFSSEPRVIATVSYLPTAPPMIQFVLMIENPSSHFLSFSLSMEPNEKMAFSGMKQSILQLLPLSRKSIKFQMLPIARDEWIGPIQCVIRDRYFQKVLRILPTEGMKSVKEGILVRSPPVKS